MISDKNNCGSQWNIFSERDRPDGFDLATIPERNAESARGRRGTLVNMEELEVLRKEDKEEMFQPIKHLSGDQQGIIPQWSEASFLSSSQSISGMEAQFLTFDSVMRLRETSLNFRFYKNRKEWTHFVP